MIVGAMIVETPLETLLISSSFCGGNGEHMEEQIQTPAKRTLKIVATRENIATAKSGKHSRLGNNGLNARSYKKLLRSRVLRAKATNVLLQSRDKLSGEDGQFTVSNGSNEVDKGVAVTHPSHLKMPRFTAKPGRNLSSVSLSKESVYLQMPSCGVVDIFLLPMLSWII
ncbi:hypothetical protein Vadar_008353 [Vaccinium darrowii]|uniref:Uncharacterized protein n=1 Tax=Vaccinium darrowii TaxID=229202 RepID=A0ACB7XG73_9ERIC|nr:hypothetical protein Vadar_008353 [Vaccinium darrowii]